MDNVKKLRTKLGPNRPKLGSKWGFPAIFLIFLKEERSDEIDISYQLILYIISFPYNPTVPFFRHRIVKWPWIEFKIRAMLFKKSWNLFYSNVVVRLVKLDSFVSFVNGEEFTVFLIFSCFFLPRNSINAPKKFFQVYVSIQQRIQQDFDTMDVVTCDTKARDFIYKRYPQKYLDKSLFSFCIWFTDIDRKLSIHLQLISGKFSVNNDIPTTQSFDYFC